MLIIGFAILVLLNIISHIWWSLWYLLIYLLPNNDACHHTILIMNSKLGTFVEIFDLTKNDLFKCWQYACLLTTWFYERNGNKELTTKYFTLYQKIFHIRRIHRVLQSLVYLPVIRNYIRKLKEEVTFTSIFGLLGNPSIMKVPFQ